MGVADGRMRVENTMSWVSTSDVRGSKGLLSLFGLIHLAKLVRINVTTIALE